MISTAHTSFGWQLTPFMLSFDVRPSPGVPEYGPGAQRELDVVEVEATSVTRTERYKYHRVS